MKRWMALVVVVSAAIEGSAWAGQKAASASSVYIDRSLMFASGVLSQVRNTADSRQNIACEVHTYAGGTGYVACYAMPVTDTGVYCSSTDPALMAAAGTIHGDTWLLFSWNASGQCTQVATANNSAYGPKQP